MAEAEMMDNGARRDAPRRFLAGVLLSLGACAVLGALLGGAPREIGSPISLGLTASVPDPPLAAVRSVSPSRANRTDVVPECSVTTVPGSELRRGVLMLQDIAVLELTVTASTRVNLELHGAWLRKERTQRLPGDLGSMRLPAGGTTAAASCSDRQHVSASEILDAIVMTGGVDLRVGRTVADATSALDGLFTDPQYTLVEDDERPPTLTLDAGQGVSTTFVATLYGGRDAPVAGDVASADSLLLELDLLIRQLDTGATSRQLLTTPVVHVLRFLQAGSVV
jgi:hypothetical protein